MLDRTAEKVTVRVFVRVLSAARSSLLAVGSTDGLRMGRLERIGSLELARWSRQCSWEAQDLQWIGAGTASGERETDGQRSQNWAGQWRR